MSTEEVITDTCILISSIIKSGDTLLLPKATTDVLVHTFEKPSTKIVELKYTTTERTRIKEFLEETLTTRRSNQHYLKTLQFVEQRTEKDNDNVIEENLMLLKTIFFLCGFITCTILGNIKIKLFLIN